MPLENSGSSFCDRDAPLRPFVKFVLDKVGTMVGEKIRESETDGGKEGGCGGVEEM